ncbi:hypothetical protein AB6A40_003883 [Gnathostoma spinigerum]|uniref:YTH domain-containing protein n=1 Tax=Gnathostoma spinigerum TaxID=75299 RepID=A0ABD6EAU8_9BILA
MNPTTESSERRIDQAVKVDSKVQSKEDIDGDEELDLNDLIIQDEYEDTSQEDGDNLKELKRRNSFSVPQNREIVEITKKRYHSASPCRYTRPPYVLCSESVDVHYLMHRAQFFLARSCRANIALAKQKRLWTTNPRVEVLLNDAFRKAPNVILIFMSKDSDHFSGFARMSSLAQYRNQPAVRWKDFSGGGNIRINWISRHSLPFEATKHIKNPFNRGKEIYAGSDGSEIQRAAGQRLCGMFSIDRDIDLSSVRRSKAQVRHDHRPQRSRRRSVSNVDDHVHRDTLPSLFDTKISYNDFKRAQRDLNVDTDTDSWRRESDSYSVPHCSSLSRPVPLMDIRLSRFPSSHTSHSSLLSHDSVPRRSSPLRFERGVRISSQHSIRISPPKRESRHLHRESISSRYFADEKRLKRRRSTSSTRYVADTRKPSKRRKRSCSRDVYYVSGTEPAKKSSKIPSLFSRTTGSASTRIHHVYDRSHERRSSRGGTDRMSSSKNARVVTEYHRSRLSRDESQHRTSRHH